MQFHVPVDDRCPESGLFAVLMDGDRTGDEIFIDSFQMKEYSTHPYSQAMLQKYFNAHPHLRDKGGEKGGKSGKGAPRGSRTQRARGQRS